MGAGVISSIPLRLAAAAGLTITLTACASGSPKTPAGLGSSPTTASSAPKTITLGQLNAVKAYAPWDFNDTSGGGALLAEIHMSSLVSQDALGVREARLAERVPSFEDGSIQVLGDGRMRVSWKLHSGVTWHDGAPFTSDDLSFSWEVLSSPDITSSGSQTTVVRRIDSVEAPDPLTFVMVWKTTYFQALDMGVRNLWPFPKHLLAQAFAGDKQAFLANPYFTTDYVHLGPFRLVQFQPGETQVFQRFDDFFLGRPKVDTIVIRSIGEPNALFANIKAGVVDIAGERTLPSELFLLLRQDWRQDGGGVVVDRQYNWRYLQVQQGAEWARPVELAQDVRVRRALLQANDRHALREVLYPGFANTVGDTFMLAHDARAEIVGQPFARYSYDPGRAMQDLLEAGWQRAADGRMLGRDGRQLQIEIRGGNTDVTNVAFVADAWRRLGIDASEVIVSGPTNSDPEYRSTFPGVETTARGAGDQIFPNFDGRLQSLAENRWTGGNRMHYANPALDRLADRLYATVDPREQGLILKDMGEIMATDLPILPQHFVMEFAAVAKGMHAITDDFVSNLGPGNGAGLLARGAYSWERV